MKLLICSYHFPPFNVAASRRAHAWAKYLPEEGWRTTVLTVQHQGEPVAVPSDVIALELPQGLSQDDPSMFWSLPAARTMKAAYHFAKGEFDYHVKSANDATWEFLSEHLKNNKYDLMLAMYSPHYHIAHAHRAFKEFGLPFVVDFRDLFDNGLACDLPQKSNRTQFLNDIILRKWKQWMSTSSGWCTVSEPLALKLQEWFNTEGACVLNGVDLEEYQSIPAIPNDKFTLLFSGSVATNHRMDLFLEAWEEFQEGKENVEMVIMGNLTHFTFFKEKFIEQFGKEPSVTLVSQVGRTEAIGRQKGASVLFCPNLEEMCGCYTTKIFEYLSSKNAMILAPSDKGVLENLFSKHDGCFVSSSRIELLETIEMLHTKWASGEQVPYQRNLKELDRKHQAHVMSEYLRKVIQ
ncbi:MAG: glycosyltransferase [Flavobacteriales bacterium]